MALIISIMVKGNGSLFWVYSGHVYLMFISDIRVKITNLLLLSAHTNIFEGNEELLKDSF